MRDPHVVSLTYSLVTDSTTTYKDPPALSFEAPLARFDLNAGVLTVTMKEHFASPTDARKAVSSVLSAWELRTELASSAGRLGFEYQDAQVVDRDPPKAGEPQVITMEGMSTVGFSAHAALHLTIPRYPDPPTDFVATPEIEALAARWRAYRTNREPLLSAGYYIVTHLQKKFGKDAAVGAALGVSRNVIAKLHAITGGYGDETTARKSISNARPLTGAHTVWIEQVVPRLLLRLAQLPITSPTTTLDLSDFPPLPD